MAFRLSTSLMCGSLSEKIEQAQKAGFQGIDININDINASEISTKQLSKIIKKAGLEVGALLPFYDFEGYEGAKRELAFKRLHWHIDIATDLNASFLLIGASSDPSTHHNHDALINDFKEAADIADKKGLKIAYLALPWAAYIQDTLDAYQLVEAVDHRAFGLAMNSFFALADGSKSARYRNIDGQNVFIVQLADAPYSEFDIRHLKHAFACLPGLGDLNLASFLNSLRKNGYSGDISLARMGQADEAHRESASDGFRALSNLVDEAQNEPQSSKLPARAYTKGIEFLEFVVDAESGLKLRSLLKSLCFRCERNHKSKPVELWRQGAINIVLNEATEGYAYQSLTANGPGLCDMALRVDSAEQTVKRATALGIKPVHQSVGVGELKIPAIEGVGHSLIHFIDEQSDLHHVWEIDFAPRCENEVVAPAGLRRIDHVAQTMKATELDSWLLFYLSVFDMKKSPLVDMFDPSGVTYSRAVESPEGELRLSLNGANSQGTISGAFLADRVEAGFQHIAFSTDDIFETAKQLNESGFEALTIADNYYDALSNELNLEAEFVRKLQNHNVLYSRNKTSEFFQLYSTPIWGGFFFEIVERKSGYSGYGARNAHIRLAAQARHLHEVSAKTA